MEMMGIILNAAFFSVVEALIDPRREPDGIGTQIC
jgi:hypothetical protein